MKQPLEFNAKKGLVELNTKRNKAANIISLLASTLACAS